MNERRYLSWYCDNAQHFQCDEYHPRVLQRCDCPCHDVVLGKHPVPQLPQDLDRDLRSS